MDAHHGPHPAPRAPLAAMAMMALAALAGPIPHARANSPPCTGISGKGAVTDTNTGLTWQTAASSSTYTLAQAQAYCGALVLNGVGPSLWRLPTIRELQTIVHEGKYDPAIDTATFTDLQQGFFWSSSPLLATPGNQWGVYFDYGNTGTSPVGSSHAVRCVYLP